MRNERYQCKRALVTFVERIEELEEQSTEIEVDPLEVCWLGSRLTNIRLTNLLHDNGVTSEIFNDDAVVPLIRRTNRINAEELRASMALSNEISTPLGELE